TIVQVEDGQFLGSAVRPEQRTVEAAFVSGFIHCETYPVFAVSGSSLNFGLAGISGRGFRNENVAGEVDGYLAAVLSVGDEQQALVGDCHGLVECVKRLRERAELMPFARLDIDDGGLELIGIVRRDGRYETAGILAARRHGRP